MKHKTKCKAENWLSPELHRAAVVWLLLISGVIQAVAQSLTFSTLAGHGGPGAADGAGSAAGFNNALGTAVDSAGNIYVADTGNHTIRKITPGGFCTTLAGLAGVAGTTDGTNSGALFNRPSGIAVDSSGTVYVADTGNHTIRKVTPAGIVTTFAGSAGTNGTANGHGTSAQFYFPQGVAVDSSGTLYVADTWNHTIRMIQPGGNVFTFAGSPGLSGTNDGSGSSARFNQPQGIIVNGSGNIWVADTGNQTIRSISSGGGVVTLAGLPLASGTADGLGSNARFHDPRGICVDSTGNVYIADYWNQTIRSLSLGGVVSTVAGLPTISGSADGLNGNARFWGPAGIAITGTSVLYVTDSVNGTVRKIAASGPNWVASTVSGYPSAGTADATQAAAQFYWPAGLAVDGQGNTFVADTHNHVIRKVTPAGVVTTFAGSPGVAGSLDGTGGNARFNAPQGVAVDSSGFVYVADTGNHTIRTIASGGMVTTLAGSVGSVGPLDGSGSSALFNHPQALAVDGGSGTIYVADTWNHTIRQVTPGGTVTTLAGLAGSAGGSDGTNSKARFYYPSGIAARSGNIYVADGFNHTIRSVTAAGVVTTLAGMPGAYGSADATNSAARFFEPQGIAVDGSGTIYVTDSGNQTLRRIAPSGTNWIVTTVAGLPGLTGSVNGTGTGNRFNSSAGLALDAAGNVYVADLGNNAIRVSRLVAPQLQVARASNNQGSVFWPTSGYGFLLEMSAILPSGWAVVTTNVMTSGDMSVANFPPGTPSGFYRLHKP